jgi:molybdenum cofactor cytidylyltransferase
MDFERLACVVLAAGRSRRFENGNKLQADLGGKPVGFWAIETVAWLGLQQVVVVCSEATPISLRAYALSLGMICSQNGEPDTGMGRSLAIGAQLLEDAEGVFIALADMPLVTAEDFAALAAVLDQKGPDAIAIPTFEGQRGHPVLFGPTHFHQLRLCDGDVGARFIIMNHADKVVEVKRPNGGILVDIDTDEALERISAKLK